MLRLRIVGPMSGEHEGVPVVMPTSERARALIGWLALHPGPNDRARVAAVLWPDAAPDRARANLRTAVWAVHQAWGRAATHLTSTRTTIGLDDSVSVDVGDESSDQELLPGVEDDWLTAAREEHHGRVIERLAARARAAEHDGDVATAVRLSREVCRRAPYDEVAHRALLRRLLLNGDRASAIVASREFGERLREELGVRPSPATRAVQAEARDGAHNTPRQPMFGRASEARVLASVWRSAARGEGQVVIVSGEAGIGKSSLITDLVGHVEARGGRSSVAVGADVATQTPFAAWLELCHGLAGSVLPPPPAAVWPFELNRLSGELGARLGHPGSPTPVTAPELERLRVFESVLALVEWSCSDRPTLLVLDDAHRVDRASLRLTGHLGRRLARLPLLVVLSRRDFVPSPQLDALVADLHGRGVGLTHVPLGPIDDRAISAIASSVHPLDDTALDRVVTAAEGNPLLAVESTRAIGAGDEGPPANLRIAVRAALGRLAPAALDLVRALAVAGRPLTPQELERLDADDFDEAEDAAATEGLVVRRAGRLGFRHDLLRDAVYADLAAATRLHDQLAAVVDPSQHADVAHHLELAGRTHESAQELALAAADAWSVGALEAATEFLTRATTLNPDDGLLWLELEEVSAWSGRTAEMEAAWSRALTLLQPAQLAGAWCRRGRQYRSVVCRPAASRHCYLTARALLTTDSAPSLHVECLVGLAWGDAVAGEGLEFEELLAAAEATAGQTSDETLTSDIAEIRMLGLIRAEQFDAAAEVARTFAHHQTSTQRPDRAHAILTNGTCACLCSGDLPGALALAEVAVSASRPVPSLHHESVTARAHVLALLGRHEEAAESVAEMREIADRIGVPKLIATTPHDAGLVALAAGRHHEAAALLAEALERKAPVSRPSARLRQAESLALAGDVAGAKSALRQALQEPVGHADQPWSLVPRIAYVQALVAHAEGDTVEATRRLDEADRAWRRVSETMGARTVDGYFATLVDLGRPPVVGLVDPARELTRIDALRRTLPSPAMR